MSSSPTHDELRLILQNIEALKKRTINDLDALAAQVVSFLPKEDCERGKRFRRYTRGDWESYLAGTEQRHDCRAARLKIVG